MKEEVINLKSAVNDGHFYVYCENRDAYMFYISSINDRFGMWSCPHCRAKVKEKKVYSQMEKEVEKTLAHILGKEKAKEYHHMMKELKDNSTTERTKGR